MILFLNNWFFRYDFVHQNIEEEGVMNNEKTLNCIFVFK